MIFWIGGAFALALICLGTAYSVVSRRRRLILLRWKPAKLPFDFVRSCRDYLVLDGWELKDESHAGIDLKMAADGMDILLFCRSAGWQLGSDYVEHVGWLEKLHREPVIIVLEEPPTDLNYGLANLVGVKLIHYSELHALRQIAVDRIEWLRQGPATDEPKPACDAARA